MTRTRSKQTAVTGTVLAFPVTVTAPWPESLNDPERAARFLQDIDWALAFLGLPPLAAAQPQRLRVVR